jgi:hypothetical protein
MTAQQRRPASTVYTRVTPTRAGAHPRKCTVRAGIMGPTRTSIVHLWLKPPVKRSKSDQNYGEEERAEEGGQRQERMSTRGRRNREEMATHELSLGAQCHVELSSRWYSLSRIRTRDYVDDG